LEDLKAQAVLLKEKKRIFRAKTLAAAAAKRRSDLEKEKIKNIGVSEGFAKEAAVAHIEEALKADEAMAAAEVAEVMLQTEKDELKADTDALGGIIEH